MTILGFDYGEKRVGVALARDDQIEPLTVVDGTVELDAQIHALVRAHRPDKLVVGLPRNLSGEDTLQTKEARAFAHRLGELTHLPVELQDEAMSSERAMERLGKRIGPKERKQQLDQVAAQIILEDYLQ